MVADMISNPMFIAGALVSMCIVAAILLWIAITYINKHIITQSRFSEKVVRKLKLPISTYVVLIGLYFGSRQLPALIDYTTHIDSTFFVLSAFFIAFITSRLASAFIHYHIDSSDKHRTTPRILDLIISIIIFTAAIVTILQYFNVQITAIIATLGIGGLAIGLALQGTLANLFAGIHLITTEPIRVGDFIELENGLRGYVIDIDWRETTIRQIENTFVIIPNNKLAESIIINNSMPEEELGCRVSCGVDYTSDLDHVERICVEVATRAQAEVEGAIRDHKPFVRFQEFGDNNINFQVFLRVENFLARWRMTHEFMKMLKKRFDEEGIEISWPIRKIYNK